MICNYDGYQKLYESWFCTHTIPTDAEQNRGTEELRKYIVNGGAGDVLMQLGIGISVTTRSSIFTDSEVIRKRFVWVEGERKGKELTMTEIEMIGVFLPGGGLCGTEVHRNDR